MITPTLGAGIRADVLEMTLPLPPVVLRANGRAHYMVKNRAADAYSLEVLGCFAPWSFFAQRTINPWPWLKAHVTYTWCYSGVRPDHGNLGGNTKYLQDILCMAPKSKAGKNRWYMGVIEDDKGIEANYLLYKVAHKADECVVVRIEKR